MKTTILSFRANENLAELIDKAAIKFCMTRNQYLNYIVFQKTFAYLNKQPTNEVKKLLQKAQLTRSREDHKEKNHCRYLIGNTIRKIRNMAMQSMMVNGGEINMKPIQAIIKQAEKEWKLFPSDVKRELKQDYQALLLYKTYAGLEKSITSMRRLNQK